VAATTRALWFLVAALTLVAAVALPWFIVVRVWERGEEPYWERPVTEPRVDDVVDAERAPLPTASLAPNSAVPPAPPSGSATGIASPRGNLALGATTVSGGAIADVGATVAAMAAGFRRCYQRGLERDPEMSGTLRLSVEVGANGEVVATTPAGGEGLSPTVIACTGGVVASRVFAKPKGGPATLVIPLSFFVAK